MYNVLFLILWILVGYRVWEYKINTQKDNLIKQAWTIAKLDAKIERYTQYVPKTEIKKFQIIKLHQLGYTSREIWSSLKIDSSAISRALKRWNIK
jgi:hypothetical protein